MFKFNEGPFKSSSPEIFQGISQATILEIHDYLDTTFGVVVDDTLDGGETEFNITGIPEERREEASERIGMIVGDRYAVVSSIKKEEGEEVYIVTVTNKIE